MNPRRVAIEMWPTLVFGGGLVGLFACIGLVENSDAVRVVDRLAPSLTANAGAVAAPKPTSTSNPTVGSADIATAAELLAEVAIDPSATESKPQTVVVATLGDPSEVLPQQTPIVQAAAPSLADPAPQETVAARNRIELVGECMVAEACIDQYLWALYARTPKEDTTRETERRKVSIKRKGKMVTVTRSFTKLVDNDFTWKDPKAAERARLSMIDYVIGGMDRSFKRKLFYMLQAAENAGLSPGITSAFRDDYRQSIASGLKAASDRSYHGGSFRGGYGHGLAADIVSTNGATRAQRWVSTEALWKWVDTNGKQFGIGRPYLDRDPPHVGPIDGQEYVSRRGDGTKVASADVKRKRNKHAAHEKPAATKRPVAARPSKVKSI
jgi:D-alanyl-D-alanine carboxypeptidase